MMSGQRSRTARATAAEKVRLLSIYTRLLVRFGPRHWWPAKTAEEVIIGAVLAQSTSWSNAARAVANLRAVGCLGLRRINALEPARLAELIRPARYFNQKARALKAFADYAGRRYGFSLRKMRGRDMGALRAELLGLYRIGPETADSMLLYALGKPAFVIDLYTRRILSRHGILSMEHGYDDFQRYFVERLSPDAELYNEFHALLVHLGNQYCKPAPDCGACPLRGI